jgi:predicted CoA-binding protein
MPKSIAEFLNGHRIVVAGVSQDPTSLANALYKKLKTSGYDVVPMNPKGGEVEGVRCAPDLASVDGAIDGVFAVTPARAGADLVRQCSERGVKRIWFHRSFGQGSVAKDAIAEAEKRGITCIAGGCPMMFCEPVDVGHKCIRWFMRVTHSLPN